MKVKMKRLSTLLVMGMFLFSFMSVGVLAQETSENPGITPDSFLWGIDRALEKITLLLETNPGEKAKKRLKIAQERLAEIKKMIEENKLEAAKKAEESHGKTLTQILQDIEEIEKGNSTEEIEEVIEIEKELHDHNEEVDQVFGELKIKIKIEGELTQAQQDLIDSILNNLKGQTGEVEIEIKIKKDKTKIKIKIETGKSDEEIDDEIKKLEIKKGLGKIKVRAEIVNGETEVKLKMKFFTNITDKDDVIQEIIDQFALDNETADAALKIEDEEGGRLEEKFKVKVKVQKDKTKVEVELKFILNATDRESILDAIVERSQLTQEQIEDAIEFKDKKEKKEKDEEELEIEVEIEDGVAKIEVELNGKEFEFTLDTTDREEIISEIMERTGLTREQVDAVIEFEIEDEDEEEDEEEEEEDEEEDEEEEEEEETNETEG